MGGVIFEGGGEGDFWESLCRKAKRKVGILYFTHYQYSGLNLVLAGLL